MCPTITIHVHRFNPEADIEPVWKAYAVPYENKSTVLGALQYIQEKIDPSLAFRYGCRYRRCGLCAVEINGKPAMACYTYAEDGLRVGPLSGLHLIRDLVVDRKSIFEELRKYSLYLEPSDGHNARLTPVMEPEQGARLRSCLECLSCISLCPHRSSGEGYGVPLIYVRLAQLHFDPRDRKDRLAQAKLLGIDRCRSCNKCFCPNGIAIIKDAIKPLLGG